jgi:putative transposase
MSASASGTLEEPGKCVKAKAGLNKSILDQGWGTFRRFLEYKLAWSGGTLIAVPPKYTSTSCSSCGFSSAENRKSQASFACLKCAHKQNADLNAAKNILAAGRAVIACGEKALAISLKQEPTVSTIPIV